MAETVLITGATSAIGSALAREYAAPGVTLYLHGRNAQRLQEVAAACQVQGAQVVTTRLDVRDFTALRAWLEALEPLDLVIINAGMNTHIGPHGEPEPWDEVEALLDVNLKAAMVIAHAVLPAMRAPASKMRRSPKTTRRAAARISSSPSNLAVSSGLIPAGSPIARARIGRDAPVAQAFVFKAAS